MRHPPSKAVNYLPVTGLVAFTQAALGFGVGLLVAGTMRKHAQQNAALAVLAVGALATVPLVVDVFSRLLRGPESERGMRQRLESIRGDTDYPEGVEFF